MVSDSMTPVEGIVAASPNIIFSVRTTHSSKNSSTALSKSNFEQVLLQDFYGNKPIHIKAVQLTHSEITKVINLDASRKIKAICILQ